MKRNIGIVLIFAVWFLVGQPCQVLAQAVTATDYNIIEWSQISSNELTVIVAKADPSKIPADAWGIILKKADWFKLPTNVQYYVSENVDWSLVPTNIIEYYNQPGEWVDSPQKHATLKLCANQLRSSIDTNWLAQIYDKLTNRPAILQFTNLVNGTESIKTVTNADIIEQFQTFSKYLKFKLDKYANYLTDSKLKTYLGVGCEGEMQNTDDGEGVIYFGFESKAGLIRDLSQTVEDEPTARVQAYFFGNGKLKSFHSAKNEINCNFNENGQLEDFSSIVDKNSIIHLGLDAMGNLTVSSPNGQILELDASGKPKLDAAGNLHIGGYVLKMPVLPK